MTTDQDRAASAIRANPEPHHQIGRHLHVEDFEPVVTGWLGFERHELRAMGACVVIAAVTFLAIYLKTGSL